METSLNITDIKSLTDPSIVSELGPAFQKYNEEQFTTVKLPGSSQSVGEIYCRERFGRLLTAHLCRFL